MTDDERLQRLTEMARRVWPDERGVRIIAEYGGYRVVSGVLVGEENELLCVYHHHRVFDALEAALHVLAGEAPAWVEEIASEWQAEAKRRNALSQEAQERDERGYSAYCGGCSASHARCAAELRERARQR